MNISTLCNITTYRLPAKKQKRFKTIDYKRVKAIYRTQITGSESAEQKRVIWYGIVTSEYKRMFSMVSSTSRKHHRVTRKPKYPTADRVSKKQNKKQSKTLGKHDSYRYKGRYIRVSDYNA